MGLPSSGHIVYEPTFAAVPPLGFHLITSCTVLPYLWGGPAIVITSRHWAPCWSVGPYFIRTVQPPRCILDPPSRRRTR